VPRLTSTAKINGIPEKSTKILLAPLDWGLGHATRCIPIVKELLRLKCDVTIAASGGQKAMLKEEFPCLTYVEIPGYGVKYGKNRAFTWVKIFALIPKILIGVNAEKAWFKRFLERERPDLVISDNRYGLHDERVFSVFITHQLRIRTPFGNGGDAILQWIQYRFIRHFSLIWVPDREEASAKSGPAKEFSLAGALSHPERLPSIPTRYIGPLSRFGKMSEEQTEPYDLLILLSGPEPQRTIFEKAILLQLVDYAGKAVLLRGLPDAPPSILTAACDFPQSSQLLPHPHFLPLLPHLTIHDHLPSGALNALICSASLVLSRPGYSSVMDLIPLQKKCVFVPTPGQTEQEYLGKYLADKNLAMCRRQRGFSLPEAIKAANEFPFAGLSPTRDLHVAAAAPGLPAPQLLRKAVEDLLKSVQDVALG
jgi:Glycosyltransferase family 28 C-terminal domain